MRLLTKFIALSFGLFITAFAFGQISTNINPYWAKMNSKERFEALKFTTSAYQETVLQLIIEEANRFAGDLNLMEQLPIKRTNLLEAYLSPPRLAFASKRLGNITTSNYIYGISAGNKLSFLMRTSLQQDEIKIRVAYVLPVKEIDTNSAYQLALQFLKAASVDIEALNAHCVVRINTCMVEGIHGQHFVPLYWINWSEKSHELGGALVELCLPTKNLLQLRVNKSEYIARTPILITNLDYLLSQTSNLATTNRIASP